MSHRSVCAPYCDAWLTRLWCSPRRRPAALRAIPAAAAAAGLRQADLAEAVGRSQQWVSALDGGRSDPCLGDVMAALCALGVIVAVRAANTQGDATQSDRARG